MKRLVFALFLFCLVFSTGSAATLSNNVLVLIQPALAGPNVDPLNYWQPQWVLWPPAIHNSNGGRLLSIATGANWVGDSKDFQFDPQADGHSWRSRSFDLLQQRGHFALRANMLGTTKVSLLTNESGSASPNALRLALNSDSPIVHAYKMGEDQWPVGHLMVTELSSWDDIVALEKRTTGRILVVEYPPQEDVPWTRYWLRGSQWSIHGSNLKLNPEDGVIPMQPGLAVPGLVRARLLFPLLMTPDRFVAQPVSIRSWPGANRFLHVSHFYGPTVNGIWLLSVVCVVIWGAVLVANERTSHVAPVLLAGAMLSPATVTVAGLFGRHLSVDAWPVWIGLSSIASIMLAAGLSALLRKWLPRCHPLMGVCVVGLTSMLACNPVWSFLSPLFAGKSNPVSAIALGAVFAYLVGIGAFIRGSGPRWLWVPRGASLAFLVGGCAFKCWWTEDLDATIFIAVASWVIAEGLFRSYVMVAFLCWPASLIPIIAGGFIWAPLGLLYRGRDTVGLNTAEYVDFLTSLSLWVCLTVALWVALFGYRFFFHQLRMLVRLDARREMLPSAALVSAAFGVLHPAFLSAGLVVGTGAVCALLFDAVQTM